MRALVAIAALLLAACAPTASDTAPTTEAASAGPSASVPSATEPSPAPTVTATGPSLATTVPTGPAWTPRPASSLLINSLVTVVVDRLNLRETPTATSKSLGIAEAGDFLFIDEEGPFTDGGYTWYHAIAIAKAGGPPALSVDVAQSGGIGGWIASAKGPAPYVKQVQPRCPPSIDLASLQFMLGAELLACFGGNTIELTGTFGCGGCGGVRIGIYEPAWLAYPLYAAPLTVYPVGGRLGPFAIRFAPSGPAMPPVGSVVLVRGHFDDPAASTCAISLRNPLKPDGEDLVSISADAAHLFCAQQFVVEAIEVIGTDPGFIYG
ncbi:MAG: hypothetical protein ABIZ52_01330 [Candidatus Limnocylindrales bacterium]